MTLPSCQLYAVTSAGQFLMSAPMSTIQAVFGLRRESVASIQRDLLTNPVVNFHFNGRPNALGAFAIQIRQD